MTGAAARIVRTRTPQRGMELYGEIEDPATDALIVMAQRVGEMVAAAEAEALRLSRTPSVRT